MRIDKKRDALEDNRVRCVLFCLILGFFWTIASATVPLVPMAYALDMRTNTVLYEKKADVSIDPGSMVKLMTAYVVFEQLKRGFIHSSQRFPISRNAWQRRGGRMFARLGTRLKIDTLLFGLIVDSGNDSAVALAEGVGGTEKNFVVLMNNMAAKLGMKNTRFYNATGDFVRGQRTTLRDIAVLSEALIKNFPESFKRYFSKRHFTHNRIRQRNANPLLFTRLGADGLKVGITDQKIYAISASLRRPSGTRIIFIMRGFRDAETLRNKSVSMAKWLLYTWNDYVFWRKGEPLSLRVSVRGGTSKWVGLTVTSNVVFALKRYVAAGARLRAIVPTAIAAPVSRGQSIGTLKILLPTGQNFSRELVALRSVGRSFFPFRGLDLILYSIGKKY